MESSRVPVLDREHRPVAGVGSLALALRAISKRSEFLTQQGSIVWLLEQRSQNKGSAFSLLCSWTRGQEPKAKILQPQHTKEAALKEAVPPPFQQAGQVGPEQELWEA